MYKDSEIIHLKVPFVKIQKMVISTKVFESSEFLILLFLCLLAFFSNSWFVLLRYSARNWLKKTNICSFCSPEIGLIFIRTYDLLRRICNFRNTVYFQFFTAMTELAIAFITNK